MMLELFILNVLAAAPSPPVPPELAAMSYNVRYATPKDGENAWEHRKERVVAVVQRFEPAVLGLQECLESQTRYLAKALPEYHWFGMGREADGSGEMAPIFYRLDFFAAVEGGTFWLTSRPDIPGERDWDAACVRSATWLRLLHRASGAQFAVVNTHFDHKSEKSRRESAKLIVRRMEDVAQGLPVLVLGDFNTFGGKSAPWETFAEAGYQDAWETASERVGATQTWTNYGLPKEGIDARIDWILFRGPWKCTRCEAFVDHEHGGSQPSDHLPILARLVPAPKE